MIREPMDSLAHADAAACRMTAQSFDIQVFDFLSFDHVHLPFNEGYLRILRAAYPDDHISFSSAKGHVERLAPRVADLANVTLQPCKSFETPFGLPHHNPLPGRWGARQCLNTIVRHIAGRHVRLIALLGFNASLLALIGHRWPMVSCAPLHMILHSHLGEAMAGGPATPSSAPPISFHN